MMHSAYHFTALAGLAVFLITHGVLSMTVTDLIPKLSAAVDAALAANQKQAAQIALLAAANDSLTAQLGTLTADRNAAQSDAAALAAQIDRLTAIATPTPAPAAPAVN